MAIPEEDVARVRAATDIVALIGEHAALKKVGRELDGAVPVPSGEVAVVQRQRRRGPLLLLRVPDNRATPSPLCATIEHVDFVEAVRRLADRAGVTITEDAAVTAERQRRNPLYDAMTKAVDFYHERLLGAPDGGPARDYLRSRGYDGEVVRPFQTRMGTGRLGRAGRVT